MLTNNYRQISFFLGRASWNGPPALRERSKDSGRSLGFEREVGRREVRNLNMDMHHGIKRISFVSNLLYLAD